MFLVPLLEPVYWTGPQWITQWPDSFFEQCCSWLSIQLFLSTPWLQKDSRHWSTLWLQYSTGLSSDSGTNYSAPKNPPAMSCHGSHPAHERSWGCPQLILAENTKNHGFAEAKRNEGSWKVGLECNCLSMMRPDTQCQLMKVVGSIVDWCRSCLRGLW